MDKRFLSAIILSVGVLAAWYGVASPLLFPPRPRKEAPTPSADPVPAPPAAPGGSLRPEPAPPKPAPVPAPAPGEKASPFEPTRAKAGRDAALETDRFRLELARDGATVRRLILKDFLDPSQAEPYPILQEIQEGTRSFGFFVEGAAEDLAVLPWEIAEETEDRVVFSFKTSGGLEVRKTYSLDRSPGANPYTFGLRLELYNLAPEELKVAPRLWGPAGIPSERPDQPDVRVYVAFGMDQADPTVESFGPDKVRQVLTGTFRYAGLGNKYFGVATLASGAATVESVSAETLTDSRRLKALLEVLSSEKARLRAASNARFLLRLKDLVLPKEGRSTIDFVVFAGPKREEQLREMTLQGMRTAASSFCFPASWTRALAVVMFAVLDFFHRIFGNWGIAIFLLTILVRALMVPLSIKMQVSMAEYQKKMKKIQPRMEEIKTKFKDKARQQQEMAKLMREHGVSLFPVKGCLPILLQFPIFIALFFTLQNSMELRHAPFLYISDLASPDRLFPFPAFVPLIPLLGGVLGSWFNLLPVLWIAVMLLQQKFTPMPQSDDPQVQTQRKMMLFMSVIFGVLFFQIESGCALYIITSTMWGIGEGYLIRRKMKAAEALPAPY